LLNCNDGRRARIAIGLVAKSATLVEFFAIEQYYYASIWLLKRGVPLSLPPDASHSGVRIHAQLRRQHRRYPGGRGPQRHHAERDHRLIRRRIARRNDKSRNSTMKIIAKRLLQAYFDSVARMPYPAIWMA
jgi:hypothetical protein